MSWVCPSLADKTAGLERRVIAVKMAKDSLDHFER
jgi:hypothetical protein